MSAEASAKADFIVTASSFALWATEDKSAGVRNAKALRAGVSNGAVAQLGERLLCKQEVTGSIPVGSTKSRSIKTGWRLHQEPAVLRSAAWRAGCKSPQAASRASGRGHKKVVAAKTEVLTVLGAWALGLRKAEC